MARVLFLTDNPYPPEVAGGRESSTHELCLALQSAGWEVAVAAFRRWPTPWDRVNRTLSKVHPRLAPVDACMGYPTFRGWHLRGQLARALERFGPDRVVLQVADPIPLLGWLQTLAIPAVVYLRDTAFGRWTPPPWNLSPTTFLANSGFTARSFRAFCGREAKVLPPLVEDARYRTPVHGECATLVNPVAVKGVELVLELARRRPDLPFQFVETWTTFPKGSRNEVARIKALPNARWQPRVLDMRPVYGRTRVLLVPSLWEEPWGRVVTEAQVSGIPVLARNVGGLPESVAGGGLLVPAEAGVEAWEAALGSLWDDPERHAALRERALEAAARPERQREHLLSRFLEALEAPGPWPC